MTLDSLEDDARSVSACTNEKGQDLAERKCGTPCYRSICNMSLNVSTHVSSTLLPILATQLARKPAQRFKQISYFSSTHVGKWMILVS